MFIYIYITIPVPIPIPILRIQCKTTQYNAIQYICIYVYIYTLCIYKSYVYIYIYLHYVFTLYIYVCIIYKNNTNHPILAPVFGYSRTSSRWPSFFGRQQHQTQSSVAMAKWRTMMGVEEIHGEIYGNMTTQYFIGERAIKFNWLHYPLILACSNAIMYVEYYIHSILMVFKCQMGHLWSMCLPCLTRVKQFFGALVSSHNKIDIHLKLAMVTKSDVPWKVNCMLHWKLN